MDHLQILVNQLRGEGIARFDSHVALDQVDERRDHIKDLFDQHAASVAEGTRADGRRFDAGEQAFLARQLLFVRAREVNQYFVKTKARLFIPVSNEIPSGAESHSTKVYTEIGSAALVANYGDDFPMTDAFVTEVTGSVRSLANGFGYSIQDLRRAAMVSGGQSIDARRAGAARKAHEQQVERIAALGDTGTSLPGFLKNANVPVLTAGAGGFVGGWASATSAQIWSDLKLIEQTVVTQSQDLHHPDTMVLDPVSFSILDSRPANAFTQRSILREFLDQATYIKQIDQWAKASLANASNNGPRVMAYEKSTENEALEIPQEYELFAPQQRNLQWVVPCHSRIAGSLIFYPLSAIYADGV